MATVGTSQSSSTASGKPPVSNDEAWETMLTEGMASAGIDPNADFIPDGAVPAAPDGSPASPEPTATSQDASASSDETAAPQASAGDNGQQGNDGQAPVADQETPVTTPEPEIDLSTASPFRYQRADGTEATIDGTYRIPGEGLVVSEASVPHFERLATEHDRLSAQVRDLEAQRSTFDRLTAWQVRDAQGNTSEITGVPALEQRHLMFSRTLAAAKAMGQIFDDPEKLAGLVQVTLGNDGQAYIVPNRAALESLQTTVKAAALEAELSARQQFTGRAAPPPPAEPSVESRAMPTVEQTIKALNVQGLTDQDRQYLASHVSRFLRPATADEQRQGLGKQVMDKAWQDFVQDRAAMRADAQKAAKAAEQAGKFNAGMQQQKKQPVAPKPQAKAQQPVAPTEKQSKQAVWGNLLSTALAEIEPQT